MSRITDGVRRGFSTGSYPGAHEKDASDLGLGGFRQVLRFSPPVATGKARFYLSDDIYINIYIYIYNIYKYIYIYIYIYIYTYILK